MDECSLDHHFFAGPKFQLMQQPHTVSFDHKQQTSRTLSPPCVEFGCIFNTMLSLSFLDVRMAPMDNSAGPKPRWSVRVRRGDQLQDTRPKVSLLLSLAPTIPPPSPRPSFPLALSRVLSASLPRPVHGRVAHDV